MTAPSTVTCAVCGATSGQPPVAGLPGSSEPPDFDTRPGEPLRSTITSWLQCCPACGYSAEDITQADSQTPELIRSEGFQQLRDPGSAPGPAVPFLCYAYLLDKLHQHADAGWSCLHGAWVCDDLQAPEDSVFFRNRAIDCWKRGKAVGQSFGDDLPSEFALITDVYRRLGQFEHATVACAEGLDIEDVQPALDAVLRRQMTLILARDTEVHNMRELFSRTSRT